MSFWRGLDEGEIWISHFRAGSHSGISINEWVLCPSTEPKLPDGTSSPPSLSLALCFFLKSLSVTCCEIPRRRQEKKNQEADIWFLCALKSQLLECKTACFNDYFSAGKILLVVFVVVLTLYLLPTWQMSSLSWDERPWYQTAEEHTLVATVIKPAGVRAPRWPVGIGQWQVLLTLGKIMPSPDLW